MMANRSERLKRIHARIVVEFLTGRLDTPCWTWQGAKNDKGYGLVQVGKRSAAGNRVPSYVHKVMYEDTVGPMPDGMDDLDHLCRNRACCNPEHLEPKTHAANVRVGVSIAADYAVRDECKRGHPKTPENRYERPDGKGWHCLLCGRLRARRGYRRANEARKNALLRA